MESVQSESNYEEHDMSYMMKGELLKNMSLELLLRHLNNCEDTLPV